MKLILEGIEKHFGEKQVLRGASFSFQQGRIYGLLGRNGAGKAPSVLRKASPVGWVGTFRSARLGEARLDIRRTWVRVDFGLT